MVALAWAWGTCHRSRMSGFTWNVKALAMRKWRIWRLCWDTRLKSIPIIPGSTYTDELVELDMRIEYKAKVRDPRPFFSLLSSFHVPSDLNFFCFSSVDGLKDRRNCWKWTGENICKHVYPHTKRWTQNGSICSLFLLWHYFLLLPRFQLNEEVRTI